MTAESVTLLGRQAAQALMVDACTIVHVTGRGAFNKTTGLHAADSTAAVYAGPCRVKPRDNQDRVVEVGDRPVSLWPFVISVPMSVTGVAVDDLVTITAVSPDSDPDMLNMKLRVRQVTRGSHITARRLGCELNAG